MPFWNFNVLRSNRRMTYRACALAAASFIAIAATIRAGAQPAPLGAEPAEHAQGDYVRDTTLYPWSTVCRIVAMFPDGSSKTGSGTMIGPHHCLTALHLLFNKRTRVSADRVQITPGYDYDRFRRQGLDSHPFRATGVNKYLFWQAQDIAVIVTSTNIGDLSSWMTIESLKERDLVDRSYLIAGYPRTLDGMERQGTIPTSIFHVEGDRVDLRADAPSGMDGGPICARTEKARYGEQDTWSIVGVQTGPDRGSRIPVDMRAMLYKFLKDDYSVTRTSVPIPGRAPRRVDRPESRPAPRRSSIRAERVSPQGESPLPPAETTPYP